MKMTIRTFIPEKFHKQIIGLLAIVLILIGSIQLFAPSEHSIHPINVLVELSDEEVREARNSLFAVWGTLKLLELVNDSFLQLSEWLFNLMVFSLVLSFVIEPMVTLGILFMGIGLFVEYLKRLTEPIKNWRFHYHFIWLGGYGIFFPIVFYLVMLASDVAVDKRIEAAKVKFDNISSVETANDSGVNEEENTQLTKIEEELIKQLNELQTMHEGQKENLMQYLNVDLIDLSQMEDFDPSDFSATPKLLNEEFSREVAQIIVNSIIEGATGETTVSGIKISFDFAESSSEFRDAAKEIENSDLLSLESIESLIENHNDEQGSVIGTITLGLFSDNKLNETLEKIGIQIQDLYEEVNETEEKINDLKDPNSSIFDKLSNMTSSVMSSAKSLASWSVSLVSDVITIIEVGITLMVLYLIKLVIFPIVAIFGSFFLYRVMYKHHIRHIIDRTKAEME